jgi:hypothetical protein
LACGTASGFGKVFGIFGARTALSAPTLPLPFQKTREAARPGELAHQGATADSLGPARCHESPHVLRGEFRKMLQRGLAAEMVRHK